jgi:imidazolonepropionase-like amidohydrolase
VHTAPEPMRTFVLMFSLVVALPVCAETWLIQADKIYTAPDAPPLANGVVLVKDGRIAAVADERARIAIPADAKVSGCRGVVTAGFQNSHVHFMYPRFQDAASMPAEQLAERLDDMLTRFGFTTVFDIASDQSNTFPIRDRVASGEVRGPRIRTTGLAIFPVGAIPFYLNDQPKEFLARLYQPRTAAEARQNVRSNIASGTDATKIFMVTSADGHTLVPLTAEVARAAVQESHKRGKPVLAHPTSVPGIRAALDAGVDVIVHTTMDEKNPWDEALTRRMVAQNMAVIPTLQLWPYEMRKQKAPQAVVDLLLGAAYGELRAFMAAGGQVLFGTDVGYMHELDPTDEYPHLAKAGMTPAQILASLTTAPAARWKDKNLGQVKAGFDADLVVLAGDPYQDVRNFAQVRCVFRAGVQIHPAPAD